MVHTSLCRLLGKKIRELRESRGLVLKEIESLSGISAAHISEIERGKTSPTISVLERIAKALKASVSYLLELPPVDHLRVQSPQDRQVLKDGDQMVLLERLSEPWGGGDLILHRLRLEPGGVYPGEAPPSEDVLLILKGPVSVRIGQDWRHLNSGDLLHLMTRERLRVSNPEKTQAELLWATCLGCRL